jgi:NAD-dependent deacetylase
MDKIKPIDFGSYNNIVILTGAGVAVASGIRPYRGKDGLWSDPEIADLANIETFQKDPLAVWKFWAAMRKTVRDCEPNAAHLALARIETQLRADQKFLLVTQNVDGLHQKAGSKNVVEIHGNVMRSRCSSENCTLEPFYDTNTAVEGLSYCPRCSSILRADVVQFGEGLVLEAKWAAKKALRDCDLFIAIGTSGVVAPAANFVRSADYAGARTIYINIEPMEMPNPYFKESILGKAEEILPGLVG